ncbi:methylmalonyl-CoA decarboxylase [Magnetospirillum sp. SS-4]|uniref:methylmalonyl-CoA decarboxylase n=1 Tax=Magnetospirillum sp. SS-4 TaxID=2681465 RepID=UPI0013850670|nr:methylmalonyl-CoA decarboxylase [Magnetospirillum sp. SS-4]CAA7621089.1 methylmalonyl-CoA decarboxylase, biotin-independent [Magnetospirillum sp. SS-4]
MSLIDVGIDGRLAVLTMTNQPKRNALSEAMIDGILAGLDQARAVGARCVILRAEPGVRIWSSGHDISELPKSHRDPLGWSDPLRVVIRAIEEFPAPIIALIEGGVWGGACEMALACDIIVATPDSTFAITPAKLGIPYNVTGLLTFMNAASLHTVKEMAFTARPIDAERALLVGLINHLKQPDEITGFCVEMARGIERMAPLAIAVMKEELRVLASAHSITPRMFERVQGMRREVYDSNDYQEGVRAFQEKRPPVFQGE